MIQRLHRAWHDDVMRVWIPALVAVLCILALAGWPAMQSAMGTAVEEQSQAPWWSYPVTLAVFALLPLSTWLQSRFTTRYEIHPIVLRLQLGFLSRTTSEIRIADIRNITVKQSLWGRITGVGDVAFSTAAGDREEVVFQRVVGPLRVKARVSDLQDMLADGRLDDAEQARIQRMRNQE
jgi:uncharacterized membrane protein YdbT with pleckstrin-like domain